ncbi:MAG: hypothetical protein PWQ57_1832 [Desulfovibrionales bacterium]|nr:hypothetical protein [Desulfovibrionales bacterium]
MASQKNYFLNQVRVRDGQEKKVELYLKQARPSYTKTVNDYSLPFDSIAYQIRIAKC